MLIPLALSSFRDLEGIITGLPEDSSKSDRR